MPPDITSSTETESFGHVVVKGDIEGEYTVYEKHDDGTVVLKPDLSSAAVNRRHGLTPITVDEFEREAFPLLPPDGEE